MWTSVTYLGSINLELASLASHGDVDFWSSAELIATKGALVVLKRVVSIQRGSLCVKGGVFVLVRALVIEAQRWCLGVKRALLGTQGASTDGRRELMLFWAVETD